MCDIQSLKLDREYESARNFKLPFHIVSISKKKFHLNRQKRSKTSYYFSSDKLRCKKPTCMNLIFVFCKRKKSRVN